MTAPDATAAAPSSVPAVPPVPAAARSVRFLGRDRPYWRLLIRGAALLMVTLGIYRFWLATDMRRFLWGNTEVAGDTLEYSGTPRELLVGFLIAITVLVPINIATFVASLTVLGPISAILAFALLGWFGQFAIYRARRYRLTRTVYRGIRFHQEGAAWRYAFRAVLWWIVIAITLGLAYPWAQASLERYKMSNTFYGDLGGRFVGSGTGLFFRGLLLWLIVVAPLVAGMVIAIGGVDWPAIADAIEKGGSNPWSKIENASPNLGAAVASAIIGVVWSVVAAAVLYPVFQALLLRWWVSGLRFGDLAMTSRLRTTQMYGVYLRFLGYALLFAIITGVVGFLALAAFGAVMGSLAGSDLAEFLGIGAGIVGYVVVMLGYSTIYQATVKLRSWRVAFESLELSGLHVLDRVQARGRPSSAFGEGLADALNVGGL